MVAEQQKNKTNEIMDQHHQQQQQDIACRVGKIPLVAYSIDQAKNFYDKAKNYNRPLNAALSLAENTVKFAAAKTEPFRKLMDGPIVATNKAACQQLEKLEKRYPVIMTTPDEVMKYGKEYYDRSYLKALVDSAFIVKEFGETKTKNALLNAVKTTSSTAVTVSDLVYKYSLPYLPETLEKNYVYALEYAHNLDYSFQKAQNLTEMKDEVVKEAKAKYVYFRNIAQTMYEHAQPYSPLNWLSGKDGKSIIAAAVETARNVQLYGQATATTVTLKAIQLASGTFVGVSDFAYKISSPFMPEGIEKNVVLAIQYVHDLNQNFGKATTLTELKNEVVKELKEKLVLVQHVAATIFDQASAYPPVSWLASYTRKNGVSGERDKYLINGEVMMDGGGPVANSSGSGRRYKKHD